jgi:hypothetical protein
MNDILNMVSPVAEPVNSLLNILSAIAESMNNPQNRVSAVTESVNHIRGIKSAVTESMFDILSIKSAIAESANNLRGMKSGIHYQPDLRGLFSIDMDAIRATTGRFVMISIIPYPELRFTPSRNVSTSCRGREMYAVHRAALCLHGYSHLRPSVFVFGAKYLPLRP